MHNVAEGVAYDSESKPVYSVQDITVPPLMYTLKVYSKVVEFEIDTSSGVTIMSRSAADHLFGRVAYTSSAQKLPKLPLHVINEAGPNLLGRAWLQ